MKLYEVTFEKGVDCPEGLTFPRKYWVAAPSMEYAEAAVSQNPKNLATWSIVELGQIDRVITVNG